MTGRQKWKRDDKTSVEYKREVAKFALEFKKNGNNATAAYMHIRPIPKDDKRWPQRGELAKRFAARREVVEALGGPLPAQRMLNIKPQTGINVIDLKVAAHEAWQYLARVAMGFEKPNAGRINCCNKILELYAIYLRNESVKLEAEVRGKSLAEPRDTVFTVIYSDPADRSPEKPVHIEPGRIAAPPIVANRPIELPTDMTI